MHLYKLSPLFGETSYIIVCELIFGFGLDVCPFRIPITSLIAPLLKIEI